MFIGIICFIIFLFMLFELSRDDFLFIRKNVTLETVFNTVFLSLPFVFFSSRLFYVLLHPQRAFFNPLVFFGIPYFPGLSLVGGIVGGWTFLVLYTKRKRIPTFRLLDIVGIAFLVAYTASLFLQGFFSFPTQRVVGIEGIGEGLLGVALCIFIFLQFTKSKWREGVVSFVAILFYCALAFLSFGFMMLSHTKMLLSQIILTGCLFLTSFGFFLVKTGFVGKAKKILWI